MSKRALDEGALTAAHLAVEDVLIELRDSRISVIGPANGFVVRERDASLGRCVSEHGMDCVLPSRRTWIEWRACDE